MRYVEFTCKHCDYEFRIRIPEGYSSVRTICPNCGGELVIRIREVGGGEVPDKS